MLYDDIKHKIGVSDDNADGMNRLHFRRGHFKARKTGIFWWAPHMAGNKIMGEIVSDYQVGA